MLVLRRVSQVGWTNRTGLHPPDFKIMTAPAFFTHQELRQSPLSCHTGLLKNPSSTTFKTAKNACLKIASTTISDYGRTAL